VRCNHFAAVLAGLAAIALLAADASAMYHPTLGRFLQRDPIEYADGMNLTEYGGSAPAALADPDGLAAAPVSSGTTAGYGACCCIGEEAKCSIAVELSWLNKPGAAWMRAQEPSGKGFRVNMPGRSTLKGSYWLKFGAQPHAVATLSHSEGKNVSGCHLKQDIQGRANFPEALDGVALYRWRMFAKGRKVAISPWDDKNEVATWSVQDDYNSRFLEAREVKTGKIRYTGPQFEDNPFGDHPGLGEKFVRPTMSYWWQATVSVEEAPSVRTSWGFEYTVQPGSPTGNAPQATGAYWQGDAHEEPAWAKPAEAE